MVFAQGTERQQRVPRSLPAPENVTVSGSMVVVRGFPALKSGDVTYFVMGINRLIGFVDGLKEGAAVTIEGSARSVSEDGKSKFIMPVKLTVSGKDYDFPKLERQDLSGLRERFQRGEFGAPGSPGWQMPNRPMPRQQFQAPRWQGPAPRQQFQAPQWQKNTPRQQSRPMPFGR